MSSVAETSTGKYQEPELYNVSVLIVTANRKDYGNNKPKVYLGVKDNRQEIWMIVIELSGKLVVSSVSSPWTRRVWPGTKRNIRIESTITW